MSELKPISRESVSRALERAARYRLLNEPHAAESICLDILDVEPEHQEARIALLLSLTDQFDFRLGEAEAEAKEVLAHLTNSYAQAYYEGIICERWAKIQLDEIVPGYVIYERIREAMAFYEKAEQLAPAGVDDPKLRWNTCVRILERYPDLRPRQASEPDLL